MRKAFTLRSVTRRVNAVHLFSENTSTVNRVARRRVRLDRQWAGIVLLLLLLWQQSYAQLLPSGFASVTVGSDWTQPTGLTFAKDGRMFVWEKAGKIWLVENDVKAATPFLDISEEVGDWRDHGLLGMALDPNFEKNGYFYLYYVVDRHYLMYYGTPAYNPAANEYYNATIARVTRYQANSSDNFRSVNVASRQILLGESPATGIPITYYSHAGGTLLFGSDGTLLLTAGDGASYISTDVGNASGTYYKQALDDGILTPEQNVGSFRAQQIDALSGKILRLDPATGNGVSSNPFYDAANPRAARSRVWALGFRNPFRMTRRPDTGSSNPADGNPGVLYVGDVGSSFREEMNIVNGPGRNFGWPVFEGLEPNPNFSVKKVLNRYAPNPLANQNGCSQSCFYFTDLIQQATPEPDPSFPNPCNPSVQIPAETPRFVHTRPTFDWWKGASSARTGQFQGNAATEDTVGVNSPVAGAPFTGNCTIGGVWYTGSNFPPAYRNTYFHGDFGEGWIRNFTFDGFDHPQKVDKFIGAKANVVCMAVHPVNGALYYVNLGTQEPYVQEVRKVIYSANLPPDAVASVNKPYGPTPLTVQFRGSQSVDPENRPLQYQWNFGDGTPLSTEADPVHTFTTNTTAVTTFKVSLKVTDSSGLSDTTTVNVSLNNTPPAVQIISPVNYSTYPLTSDTTVMLRAAVEDAEQDSSSLQYSWQVVLHHNNHVHEEPADTQHVTSAVISPVGCDGEMYFYTVQLTVTDAGGLTGTDEVTLLPNCFPQLNVNNFVAVAGNGQVTLQWDNPAVDFDEVMIVAKASSGIQMIPDDDSLNFTENLSFTGNGTSFDGGKVVYRGTASPQTVTGLTNGVKYYFRAFTRSGPDWSVGRAANATPATITGTEPPPGAEGISIFPNPASQEFTVQINGFPAARNAQAQLYNQAGKVVGSQLLTPTPRGWQSIVPVGQLSKGMYLLRVDLDGVTLQRKVIVE